MVRRPCSSRLPGVFAIGDVRSDSVKRVGAAIGEGSAVVAQLHACLASSAASESRRASTRGVHPGEGVQQESGGR
jgi:thioredoxin reductase (NADPH)